MNETTGTVIITYVVIGLLVQIGFSVLVSYIAGQKGRSRAGFFWLSFFTSFFIGLIVVAILPTRSKSSPYFVESSQTRVLCPFCDEDISAQAKVCKHCGRDIEPQTSEELEQKLGQDLDEEMDEEMDEENIYYRYEVFCKQCGNYFVAGARARSAKITCPKCGGKNKAKAVSFFL